MTQVPNLLDEGATLEEIREESRREKLYSQFENANFYSPTPTALFLQWQEAVSVVHLNVSTTQQGKQLLGLIYNQPLTCLLKTNFFFLCKALIATFTSSDRTCHVLIPFYL